MQRSSVMFHMTGEGKISGKREAGVGRGRGIGEQVWRRERREDNVVDRSRLGWGGLR